MGPRQKAGDATHLSKRVLLRDAKDCLQLYQRTLEDYGISIVYSKGVLEPRNVLSKLKDLYVHVKFSSSLLTVQTSLGLSLRSAANTLSATLVSHPALVIVNVAS